MMLAAKTLGDRARERRLVSARIVKTHGEARYVRVLLFATERGDKRRVDAAREQTANRHVANQTIADRFDSATLVFLQMMICVCRSSPTVLIRADRPV